MINMSFPEQVLREYHTDPASMRRAIERYLNGGPAPEFPEPESEGVIWTVCEAEDIESYSSDPRNVEYVTDHVPRALCRTPQSALFHALAQLLSDWIPERRTRAVITVLPILGGEVLVFTATAEDTPHPFDPDNFDHIEALALRHSGALAISAERTL